MSEASHDKDEPGQGIGRHDDAEPIGLSGAFKATLAPLGMGAAALIGAIVAIAQGIDYVASGRSSYLLAALGLTAVAITSFVAYKLRQHLSSKVAKLSIVLLLVLAAAGGFVVGSIVQRDAPSNAKPDTQDLELTFPQATLLARGSSGKDSGGY